MVEGDEKPRVCGVVEGDDESWPESDLVIRAGRKNANTRKSNIKSQIKTPSTPDKTYFKPVGRIRKHSTMVQDMSNEHEANQDLNLTINVSC